MKTTKQVAKPEHRRNALLLIVGVLGLGLIALLTLHRGSPPQMGNDEKVFEAVEALFTAVGAHNQQLLESCATNLDGLIKAGKLPDDASATLTQIIVKARSGNWQDADLDLRWFVKGQRPTRKSPSSTSIRPPLGRNEFAASLPNLFELYPVVELTTYPVNLVVNNARIPLRDGDSSI